MYRRPIRARMGAKDSKLKAAINDRAVRASVHRTALFSPARHATQLSLRLQKLRRNMTHAALFWRLTRVGEDL